MSLPRRGRVPNAAIVWLAFLCAAALHQLFLLTNGDMRLFGPESLDGTFNSMLLHLLHGNADVSPQAIGFESFSRDGRTYTYFGIVPAPAAGGAIHSGEHGSQLAPGLPGRRKVAFY